MLTPVWNLNFTISAVVNLLFFSQNRLFLFLLFTCDCFLLNTRFHSCVRLTLFPRFILALTHTHTHARTQINQIDNSFLYLMQKLETNAFRVLEVDQETRESHRYTVEIGPQVKATTALCRERELFVNFTRHEYIYEYNYKYL